MKLNFDYKSVFKRIVKNTSLLLLLALLVLIVAEILVVKKVVTIALRANDKPEILQTKAVRVNFKLYESLVKQSTDNDQFKPGPVSTKSPFGVIEKKIGDGDGE